MGTRTSKSMVAALTAGAVLAGLAAAPTVSADRSVRAGRHGVAVRGEEGAAAVTRRGAVAVGEEGAAARGRYGRGAAVSEEGYARYGPRGAYAVGEEGAVAVGRYGGVRVYEDNDAWKVAAGVATGIAIGTMLRRPPTTSTTVVV